MYLITNESLKDVIDSLTQTAREGLYNELDADVQTNEDAAIAVQFVQDMVGESIEDYHNRQTVRDEAILEDYADEYELD